MALLTNTSLITGCTVLHATYRVVDVNDEHPRASEGPYSTKVMSHVVLYRRLRFVVFPLATSRSHTPLMPWACKI